MKNIKLFNKILLSIGIIFITVILILFVLGSFNRIGYLSEFKINIDNTLKLNGFNLESIKESFTIDNVLDEISITNYLATNIYITNYSYDFRIKYYSKIFRNSDIYGVYLNTTSLPDYIKDIQFDKKGSPFGIFSADKKILENIDNVKYSLKPKFTFLFIILVLFIVSIIFIEFFIKFYNLYKKINYKYSYVLIVFLCFLITPNIIYKVFYDKFDHTNYENKKFAQKPELNLKKLEKYPKLYETYFNDYIPFRNELIQIKNLMDIFVFDYIIHNLTVIGKNKWLFFKTDRLFDQYIGIDKYFFTDKELEEAKYNLINFRDELKKRNIDFVLLICPDKQIIYSNYMPDYIQKKNDIDFIDQFVSYMSNNSDIKIIYPKNELLKYKDRYQLYYKYDTHWNNLGGYIAYTEFLKKMNFEFKNIEHFNILSKYSDEIDTGLYYNDLSKAINLKNIKYFNDDLIYYIDQYVYYNDKEDIYKWRDYKTRQSSISNSYDYNIFVIRDSYGHAMFDYIASSFKKSSFVFDGYFKNNQITNDNPDIVLFETVSRFLKTRLLNVIPKWRIEEINQNINTNINNN